MMQWLNGGWSSYSRKYLITHPWELAGCIGREIKYAYQRVFRGWDDRVIWSIDTYLNEKLVVWLKVLKEQKHGVPSEFFSERYDYNTTDEDFKVAEGLWNAELDKMILGFESNSKLQDFSRWSEKKEELGLLEKQFQDGMVAFVKHYNSLWD